MTKDRPTDLAVSNALLDISRAATKSHAPWALIGGQALRVYGVPRDTLDLDALIEPDNIEELADVLVEVFEWQPLKFNNNTHDYSVAKEWRIHEMDDPVLFDIGQSRQMIPLMSTIGLVVELLSAQHPIEKKMIAASAFYKHYDVTVPVAPLGGVLLVKMKADRTKDIAAIEQTAEHLPDSFIREALKFAAKLDKRTTEDLKSVMEETKLRKTPTRTVKSNRKQKK